MSPGPSVPASRSWLLLPARLAARGLVLRHLEAAERAGRALVEGGGAGDLHDFRVALRRLRTQLWAYAPVLRAGGLGPGLKRLAQRTNKARDAEACLELLRRTGVRGPAAERLEGLLARRIRRGREAGRRAALVFAALASEAARSLAMPLPEGPAPPPLAYYHERSRRRAERKLAKRLSRIRRRYRPKQAHKARIWAKRLRYLDEPFERAPSPSTRALKRLQDRLGSQRDLRRLRRLAASLRPRPPGLAALERALARREALLLAGLRQGARPGAALRP